MLVLSRKPSEELVITAANGQQIVITVREILGKQVKLGVTAHASVIVDRREIHERKNKICPS